MRCCTDRVNPRMWQHECPNGMNTVCHWNWQENKNSFQTQPYEVTHSRSTDVIIDDQTNNSRMIQKILFHEIHGMKHCTMTLAMTDSSKSHRKLGFPKEVVSCQRYTSDYRRILQILNRVRVGQFTLSPTETHAVSHEKHIIPCDEYHK